MAYVNIIRFPLFIALVIKVVGNFKDGALCSSRFLIEHVFFSGIVSHSSLGMLFFLESLTVMGEYVR